MAKSPGSVVYVITTTGFGGAERQVLDLASTFRARGWTVGVISMLPMNDQFEPLRRDGVRLATLGMRKGVPDPRGLIRLARILREWRPDVVHGHMVAGILITRLAKLLAPGPVVISTMHSQEQGGRRRYMAFRATDPLADLTTAVSRVAVDEAVRRHAVRRDNILLVPNGIRTQEYATSESLRRDTRAAFGLGERFTWLAVGRLAYVKRHADLLAAVRLVREEVPDVRLLIAGRGPLEEDLRTEVETTGLSENVLLLGLRRDIRALMQAADGFVMSSAWEGLPMVLLEASASALPIVATDVGGSRDVIAEGQTGFLAPPLDPPALAAAMLGMMKLPPDQRRAMGAEGRRHTAEAFDIDRVADQWEKIYRR